MTAKEIMDAMYECSQGEDAHCSKCVYAAYDFCHMRLYKDALDLINRQQAENERLENKLAMAKEDLEHRCSSCWYENTPSLTAPCCICLNYDKWKWRGDEDGQDT